MNLEIHYHPDPLNICLSCCTISKNRMNLIVFIDFIKKKISGR